MNRSERSTVFVEEIRKWYARHKRDLPWRDLAMKDDTERAYRVLISEIMLQQTQVSRVKIVYKDFLSRFPKLKDLSSASNKDVILAWRGMGYNNRALRLRDTAKAIASDHSALFPREMYALESLPGVGHYTAAAIRNFAFNTPTPCLDTNIRRILHRTFIGPEHADGTWPKGDHYLLKIAEEVLHQAITSDAFDARNWHAALMDYGSLVCTKRNPKWEVCPLTKAGVMKAAYRVPDLVPKKKREPGRMVGSKFIPNRIFRGRVIDELRDAKKGLSEAEIGKRICIDWNPDDHAAWLRGVIDTLKRDHLIQERRRKLLLSD